MDAQNSQVAGALLGPRLTLPRFIESFLDPLVILATLFMSVILVGESVRTHHIFLALLVVLVAFPGRLRLGDSTRSVGRSAISDWAIVGGMLLALGLVTGYIRFFSAPFVGVWMGTSLAGLVMARQAAEVWVPKVVQSAAMPRSVVVGANEVGLALAKRFIDNRYSATQFLGFFDDRVEERIGVQGIGARLGGISDLAAYIKTQRVDRIYIALPMASQPRILSLLDDLRDTTASVYFVPDIFVTDLIQGRMESVEGIPVVAVCETPFAGFNGVLKRCTDVVLSSLILLLISPIFLAVALGVRMSSPGPIIFAQRRYGLDGREIVVYKFRSMTVTEDGDKAYKQVTRGDARVTRFGEFIRKTSLDELPQFLNVLQGRMSIVGPRPHAIAVNETYRKLIPSYMVRHKVKPGITGWAQVNGYRGGDDLEHMKKRIEFDLEYVRRWSLKLDLLIVFRTVGLVAKDSSAY